MFLSMGDDCKIGHDSLCGKQDLLQPIKVILAIQEIGLTFHEMNSLCDTDDWCTNFSSW